MSIIYNRLDSYWLWKEITSKLGLSNPSYKYWQQTQSLKLNNKYLFIKKQTLPQKYTFVEPELTNLAGYLPVRYASDQLHVDPHTFTSHKMTLHNRFEYKFVENVQFVNLKRFFLEHGIRIQRQSTVHLGRLNQLEITPMSTFYPLNDTYGVVVYD